MKTIPPSLVPLARKLVWRKQTTDAEEGSEALLLYAMAYGSDTDLTLVRQYFKEEDFLDALSNAPTGMFDRQSWTYWHRVLGKDPVPPRPRRPFWPAEYEPDDSFSKCIARQLPVSR